jgi:HK97 family phage portal protein
MFADRLRGGLERRASATLGNPSTWLTESLTGFFGESYSGKTANPRSVLALIPYFSGVQLLAGAVGSLPLMVYRDGPDDIRERARDTDQWRILHDQPNPEMTADQLWELSQSQLLTWGNSFFWKERSSLGTIGELWPLLPERVQVYRDDQGVKRFVVDGGHTGLTMLTNAEILHIPGLGHDGLVGYSPVQIARQELGGMLALQEYAGRVWANSTVPIGVLTHPNKIDDDVYKRMKKSWNKAQRGPRNFGKPAILEDGVEFKAISMPLEDAQFIEAQKLGDVRCAQLLRLPPHMLAADTGGKSMVYKNAETEGIDFVRWALRRWLTRHENAIKNDPVIFPSRLGLMCEFLVDEIQRGDTKTRYESEAIMMDRGAITINEWRRRENKPPVAWGDEPYLPGMKPTSTAGRDGEVAPAD